jgi:hypothetical protein
MMDRVKELKIQSLIHHHKKPFQSPWIILYNNDKGAYFEMLLINILYSENSLFLGLRNF